MICTIYDNFLADDYCDWLVNFAEKHNDQSHDFHGRDVLNLTCEENKNLLEHPGSQLLIGLHETLGLTHRAIVGKNLELVKWPTGTSHGLHRDTAHPHTVFASICYLNDDYEGGETYFEDGTVFAPKKGRLILFDGMQVKHGVNEILKGTRYVAAAWYDPKYLR